MTDITAGHRAEGFISTRTATVACVMLAALMQALDATIANVALPHMQGSLSATPEQANWVLTSYIVSSAIATPTTGFLENRLGRRLLFMASIAGFIAASMLCGVARSLDQMIVFRLLQGIFGAPLVPLAQAVLLDTYPPARHGSAMAIFGLGVMLGPIIGPSLGGWLTDTYSWRWVFYVNLPVGAIALAGMYFFLKEPGRGYRLPFDTFGFALLALAIGSLQLFLDRGEQLDWFGSTEIQIEFGIFALTLYMFLVHVVGTEGAFVDARMFSDFNFVIGQLLIFAIGAILLATLALLTPYLERLMNYPVLEAGLVLAPRGLGTMASMLLVGPLIERYGARPLIVSGLLLTAFALHAMAGFTPDVSRWDIIRTGLVQGFGLGLVFVPLSTATFTTLAPRFRTQGTAFFSLMRNIGSSIGISATSVLLTRYTVMMHSSLAESVNAHRPGVVYSRQQGLDLTTAAGRAVLDQEITAQAMAVAYANNFRLMMYASLCVIPLALMLRPQVRSKAEKETPSR